MRLIDFDLTSGASYLQDMGWIRKEVIAHRGNPNLLGGLPFMVRVHRPDNWDKTITVLMQPRDLYVVGVRNQFGAIFFRDYRGAKLVGVDVSTLGFTGHYNDLGQYSSLSISRGAIEEAISAIAEWESADGIISKQTIRGETRYTPQAKYLLTMVLIVAEAARFWQIERAIREALDGQWISLGNDQIQQMVNSWSARSQRSGAGSPMIPTLST
jgi:hypothetical protein